MPLVEKIFMILFLAGGLFYFLACAVSFTGLFRKHPVVSTYTPFVSVITAARNEERSIGALLGGLIAQDYPADRCEFIVVDDSSDDTTADLIRQYATIDDRVRPASTFGSQSPYSHKKRAVHEGLMAARGEIIMTVDADCRIPIGWMRGMISHFTSGTDLVAGEVSISDGGLIGELETLEFLGIQSVSAGLANIGFPITCNGANLAYRRTAFDAVGGFDGIGHLVSGDDDLLMQKIARRNPSGIVYAVAANLAVAVDPVGSVSEFMAKRIRWVSKLGGYPSKAAFAFLSLVFLFLVSVPVYAVYAVAIGADWRPLAIGLFLKFAGDLLPVTHGLVRRGKTRLLRSFPLAECLHIPYIVIITFRGFFGTFVWHGRRSGGHARLYPSDEGKNE